MINTTNSSVFKDFQQFERQYKQPNTIKNNTKVKALIGTTLGTVIPLAVMMKTQKSKNPLKLDYQLKDILALSTSSITGGMLAGMYKEKNEVKKNKFKEGVFQLLNAGLPAISVAGMLKLCEKQKSLNSIYCKILAVASGIAVGMFAAIKSVNKIFDPYDKHTDRKIGPKDFIASADDAIGALALGKFPIIKALHIDKALPLAFGYCGYRAGKAE